MTLEEIMEMWDKDSVIDNLDLDDALCSTGKLHSKYLKLLSKHRLIAKTKWFKYKEKKEWYRRYYKGDFNNPEDLKKYNIEPYRGVNINIEVNNLLESEKELNELLLQKEYHDEIVYFCEAVIKELNNRTFALGSAVKMRIFEGGGL